MPRIGEVVHEAEREAIATRKPFHRCSGVLRDEFRDRRASFVMGLSPDIGGELLRAVGDPERALKPRGGGRYQTCRQRGRAARYGVALKHDDFGAALVRSERRAKPRRAGADDGDRYTTEESIGGRRLDAQPANSALVSPKRAGDRSRRIDSVRLSRVLKQNAGLGMPAQRLAFADFVSAVLGVTMLLDVDILAWRDFEDVRFQRTEEFAGDKLSLDAIGHVLLVASVHQIGADREPHL